MKTAYYKTREILRRHERKILPTFLLVGFVFDTFTLTHINLVYAYSVLGWYLFLGGCALILSYNGEERALRKKEPLRISTFAPLLLQFSFGSLFSGLVIFYTQSADIFTSLPFLVVLLVLFLGNDIIHERYRKLTFQGLIFFVGILSCALLVTPVVIGSVGILSFFLGTLAGIVFMHLFFEIFRMFNPTLFKRSRVGLSRGIIIVSSLFLVAYITNAIPPIPLSLKEAVVAHSVVRDESGNYTLLVEEQPFLEKLRGYDRAIILPPGAPLFVFTSVFSPVNISGTIVHEWSLYDEAQKKWVVSFRVPVEFVGGRSDGYRLFSFKENITPGLWRVYVKTGSGQVISRVQFSVTEGSAPALISKTY